MKRFYAEFIGTFAMVFAGCGAIIANDLSDGALGHVGICLVFGLVVMAGIYAVGNISGAHFNPAVTVGFVAAGRMKFSETLPYFAGEFCGAFLAALALRVIYPTATTLGATLPAGSLVQSFVLEVILTFLLMFVILNIATGHMEKGIMAGVAVGGTVALAALAGGPISGASMNPARSLAPALISGQLQAWWLYLVAPVLGALLAAPTCRLIQGDECCYIDEETAADDESCTPCDKQ